MPISIELYHPSLRVSNLQDHLLRGLTFSFHILLYITTHTSHPSSDTYTRIPDLTVFDFPTLPTDETQTLIANAPASTCGLLLGFSAYHILITITNIWNMIFMWCLHRLFPKFLFIPFKVRSIPFHLLLNSHHSKYGS